MKIDAEYYDSVYICAPLERPEENLLIVLENDISRPTDDRTKRIICLNRDQIRNLTRMLDAFNKERL